jgi:hypothetical protein
LNPDPSGTCPLGRHITNWSEVSIGPKCLWNISAFLNLTKQQGQNCAVSTASRKCVPEEKERQNCNFSWIEGLSVLVDCCFSFSVAPSSSIKRWKLQLFWIFWQTNFLNKISNEIQIKKAQFSLVFLIQFWDTNGQSLYFSKFWCLLVCLELFIKRSYKI